MLGLCILFTVKSPWRCTQSPPSSSSLFHFISRSSHPSRLSRAFPALLCLLPSPVLDLGNAHRLQASTDATSSGKPSQSLADGVCPYPICTSQLLPLGTWESDTSALTLAQSGTGSAQHTAQQGGAPTGCRARSCLKRVIQIHQWLQLGFCFLHRPH